MLLLDGVVLRNGVRVDAHLRGPDRIAVVGPNGSGKTTLVDTVVGTIPAVAGRVDLRVPTRLLPQRLTVLDDADTVLAGVSRLAPTADDNTLRAELARFLLDADTVVRPVGSLSGGERFRASLAALLLAEPAPQLLVLDEPTNNLDLDSVAQLTAALNAYQGALLVDQPRRTLPRRPPPHRPPRPHHLTRLRHASDLIPDFACCGIPSEVASQGSHFPAGPPRSSPRNTSGHPGPAGHAHPYEQKSAPGAAHKPSGVVVGWRSKGRGRVWQEPEPARAGGCPETAIHPAPTADRTTASPTTRISAPTVACGRLTRVAYWS